MLEDDDSEQKHQASIVIGKLRMRVVCKGLRIFGKHRFNIS